MRTEATVDFTVPSSTGCGCAARYSYRRGLRELQQTAELGKQRRPDRRVEHGKRRLGDKGIGLMDENRRELLEIYKLHAELADRVSQRRAGANRLYVTLLTGILILLAAFFRYGAGTVPVWIGWSVFGIVGMLLSASWFIVIRSYRQLNSGKFPVLLELEKKLSYPFFAREWELLEEGKNVNRYWKLTVVETFLPVGFFVLFLLLIFVGVFCQG